MPVTNNDFEFYPYFDFTLPGLKLDINKEKQIYLPQKGRSNPYFLGPSK